MKGKVADWSIENHLGRSVGLRIAGVDEVGRGSLAHSFVACACVYDPNVVIVYPIRDSKALTAGERNQLVQRLTTDFVQTGLLQIAYAQAAATEVEQNNLNQLNLRLFKEALRKLPSFDRVIIDGTIADDEFPGICAPRADQTSITVATASNFAKVYRDQQMCALDRQYPGYGFAEHRGYGTKAHLAAILKYGPIPGVHRANFLRNLGGLKAI